MYVGRPVGFGLGEGETWAVGATLVGGAVDGDGAAGGSVVPQAAASRATRAGRVVDRTRHLVVGELK